MSGEFGITERSTSSLPPPSRGAVDTTDGTKCQQASLKHDPFYGRRKINEWKRKHEPDYTTQKNHGGTQIEEFPQES